MERNEVISSILDYWVEISNKKIKKTERRNALINKALDLISHEDCINIINYILLSEDGYAIYMRENNYTSVENIFRLTKLEDKLKKANQWIKSTELPDDDFGWEIK